MYVVVVYPILCVKVIDVSYLYVSGITMVLLPLGFLEPLCPAAIKKLVADCVAVALEAQAATMANNDNTNRNTDIVNSCFDVVIGMDWLSKYHARVICDEKVLVTLPATIQRISLTGFPAQSVGSSNMDVLDLPCLLFLITRTSQSRQH
ncbi:hypothetical protein Tco_0840015, partial [Tanacetum coccineum]